MAKQVAARIEYDSVVSAIKAYHDGEIANLQIVAEDESCGLSLRGFSGVEDQISMSDDLIEAMQMVDDIIGSHTRPAVVSTVVV